MNLKNYIGIKEIKILMSGGMISGGSSVVMTTKGDLAGFDTVRNRIPIGTDAQVLTADSTESLGIKWATSASASYIKSATVSYSQTIGDYTTPVAAVATSSPSSMELEYLVVAGGGGGGGGATSRVGGGAGAGGYRTGTSTKSFGTYSVTVGAGGAKGTQGGSTGTNGSVGSNSVFDSITSNGGGYGGGSSNGGTVGAGGNGGSGGGSGHSPATSGGLGNTPSTSPSQGNDGGGGDVSGGGGIGGVGTGGIGATGGAGVVNTIRGTGSVTYSAGGNSDGSGTNGSANTGNGGNSTGNGGSGIVIIKYLTSASSGSTGGTITTDGAYTIHTFTSSGSLVLGSFSASNTIDDDTATFWKSDSEINPAIYVDSGVAKNLLGLAIYLNADTTETEIQLRASADITFTSGEATRTILVSGLTSGAWNYIRWNLVNQRYIQIYGNSGSSFVLAINEIKYLTKTDSEVLTDLTVLTISPTDTSIALNGV